MRLKKERWFVEEQTRLVQEEHKSRRTEVLTRSYETYEETPVDVIKDTAKNDLTPVILSKERVDLDDDKIEEKPKLPKRKLKNSSRMTVAELQQKVNLKASSNIILIPQHRSFKRKYSQDKGRIENLLENCRILSNELVIMKARESLREREDQKTTKLR
ncbi:hypothetical protein TNIN_220941 [Trichonephila inaurata madagascariensis]|uniref:Uncharacterized protein n=1 Tax=Trichonephila inaurata madagascariensis TaxID=2747483 RepID=A0A8X6IU39_9ARAC|nr:hypothetical protein TNIN_220941 [Trichonephila inaurata madagascariensis]